MTARSPWTAHEPALDKGGRPTGNLPKIRQVSFPCSVAEFAQLGYAGLTARDTVARYRAAWQTAIDTGHAAPVQPGDEAELPGLSWPPTDYRTGNFPERVATQVRNRSAEERAAIVRESLADPAVAAQVADRETVETITRAYHDAQPIPRSRPAPPGPDYDRMVDQGVNFINVAVASERSGKWQPGAHAEALLYFLARALDDRRRPPGNWDDLVSEVEAFANREA